MKRKQPEESIACAFDAVDKLPFGRTSRAASGARRPRRGSSSAKAETPCLQSSTPALESFAKRRRDELAVVKLDIDESPGIAERYSIRSVPTLMLFKDGEPLAMRAGMMNEAQLARFVVDQHLPRKERPAVEQDPTRPQIELKW